MTDWAGWNVTGPKVSQDKRLHRVVTPWRFLAFLIKWPLNWRFSYHFLEDTCPCEEPYTCFFSLWVKSSSLSLLLRSLFHCMYMGWEVNRAERCREQTLWRYYVASMLAAFLLITASLSNLMIYWREILNFHFFQLLLWAFAAISQREIK